MTESLAAYDGQGLMLGRKVVRCANCKHFKNSMCNYFNAFVTPDGFCAWGVEND